MEESSLHEPSLLIEEEVPENLGHEWRVLHPFELPGVRFPTDTTQSNQRRLAENDALVELIQTIPLWGQRVYQLYPPRYCDPFYRGRGRGIREMMSERPPYRGLNLRVWKRFNSGIFWKEKWQRILFPRPFRKNERYRQTEEWSDPASEGRGRIDAPISSPTAHSQQLRTPPTPAPSENRLFTDWSSIESESPPIILSPQSVPVGDTLTTPGIEGIHETHQTALQPSQPISQELYMVTANGAIQEDLSNTTNVSQQPQGRSNIPSERRMNDMGTNTSDVVIEPTRSGLKMSR